MGSARAIRWVFAVLALSLVSQTGCDWLAADPPANRVQDIQARRHPANPLITAASSPSLGENINGPSVIRVPAWVEHPLGKYYLYFAHHSGQYIRLAYADSLAGPWTVYEPGTLRLGEAPPFAGHIASPDVHVDDRRREIRMYFHGPVRGRKGQWSGLAVSYDGLRFIATKEVLGKFYFRVSPWRAAWYALAKDWDEGTDELYRFADGLTGFERRGELLDRVRHSAVLVPGSDLLVLHTRKGRCPATGSRWQPRGCSPIGVDEYPWPRRMS